MFFFKRNKKNKPEVKRRRRHSIVFGIGEQRDYFVESLSMLISSGMNIMNALDVIEREVRTKRMKKIIGEFRLDIESGFSLWEAMEKSGIFSDYIVSLVRVGEKIGGLPENLNLIVQNQQKEKIFRSRIRSAMMYPLIVFFLGSVIAIGIAWFILPRLAEVFLQLKIDLPIATKILISIGEFLGEYGTIVIPLIVFFLILLIFFVFVFKKTRFLGQALILSLPGIGRLVQELELARTGFILGSILDAGLTIVDSVESLSKTTGIRRYQNLYIYLGKSIEEGNSFKDSFKKYPQSEKLIPPSIQQMIITGEQSGSLPQTLKKIGSIFESKTEITTKNLTVILEPILLIIVWLGVIFVALAIILPIYSLIGGLNQPVNVNDTSRSAPSIQIQESEEVVEESLIEDFGHEGVEEGVESEKTFLRIVSTGIGYLNVRGGPSVTNEIIGRVYPEESYEYLQKSSDWYEIVLPANDDQEEVTGWVSGRYAEEID